LEFPVGFSKQAPNVRQGWCRVLGGGVHGVLFAGLET
jgi:hypothetical protein